MKHYQSPFVPDPERVRKERLANRASVLAAACIGLAIFDGFLLRFWGLSFAESLLIVFLSALSLTVGIVCAHHIHIKD